MHHPHLNLLKAELERSLPENREVILQAWEAPGFQETIWEYRVAMVPQVSPEDAARGRTGLVVHPRRTPGEVVDLFNGIHDRAKWLKRNLGKIPPAKCKSMCGITAKRWTGFLKDLTSLISRSREVAEVFAGEMEPKAGKRKRLTRNIPLEDLLLEMAKAIQPLQGRGTKRLVMEMARVVHSWAMGRHETNPKSPGDPEGMWAFSMDEISGDWGDGPWRKIQPRLQAWTGHSIDGTPSREI